MEIKLTLTEEQVDYLAEQVAAKLGERERSEPYSLAEASRALGVSEGTVRNRIAAGLIEKLDWAGDRVLIPAREIKRLQEGR